MTPHMAHCLKTQTHLGLVQEVRQLQKKELGDGHCPCGVRCWQGIRKTTQGKLD